MKIWGRKKRDRDEEGLPSLVVIRLNGEQDLWGKFKYTLGPGEDTVGRDEACSIQILDPEISRRHVSVEAQLQAGGFVLRDLGSANGTLLNGQRMTEPCVLQEGDVIQVGNSQLLFTSRPVEGQIGAIQFKSYGERRVGTMPGGLRAEQPPGDEGEKGEEGAGGPPEPRSG